MASKWCVRPEEETLNLDFADESGETTAFWIKVKKHLTVGEERRVQTAGFGGFKQGARQPGKEQETEITVNWQSQSFARTEAYLTDWSLTDDKQNKMPHSREVIESLRPEVFAVIETAINAHIKKMADEKKVTAGSSAPVAMSA